MKKFRILIVDDNDFFRQTLKTTLQESLPKIAIDEAAGGGEALHGGHTRVLIDHLFKGATAAGADCEAVTLARCKVNRCLVCGKCHTSEHYLECLYSEKDDVAAIFAKIASADLVIYASPVYVFGVSSLLKTFLERFYSTSDVNQLRVTRNGLFFHQVDERICTKPFVSIVVCDNIDPETPKNACDRRFSRITLTFCFFDDIALLDVFLERLKGCVHLLVTAVLRVLLRAQCFLDRPPGDTHKLCNGPRP